MATVETDPDGWRKAMATLRTDGVLHVHEDNTEMVEALRGLAETGSIEETTPKQMLRFVHAK